MMEVHGLEKSFKDLHALRGVTFMARDNEITGLIGPNGAGKTTTLRMLYTVMSPDAGWAKVDGFDTMQDRVEVQKRIGVLPDNRVG